jgi:hypothetical protein
VAVLHEHGGAYEDRDVAVLWLWQDMGDFGRGFPRPGPFVLAFAAYDFRCPNACRSYSDDSPKEFDETNIPEGLSFRPLKYREEGTAQWRDIPGGAA